MKVKVKVKSEEDKEAHVAELIEKARFAGLEGCRWLAQFTIEEITLGYNGIGPEFMPGWLRDITSDRLALFGPCAVIHDMRNDVSDGTRAAFLQANDEFRRNCLKMADLAYPQRPGVEDDLKRARAKAVAEILYCFVSADNFGWRAWQEAHERYLERQAAASQNKENEQ